MYRPDNQLLLRNRTTDVVIVCWSRQHIEDGFANCSVVLQRIKFMIGRKPFGPFFFNGCTTSDDAKKDKCEEKVFHRYMIIKK